MDGKVSQFLECFFHVPVIASYQISQALCDVYFVVSPDAAAATDKANIQDNDRTNYKVVPGTFIKYDHPSLIKLMQILLDIYIVIDF